MFEKYNNINSLSVRGNNIRKDIHFLRKEFIFNYSSHFFLNYFPCNFFNTINNFKNIPTSQSEHTQEILR
jgi:hypothetical protein